MPDSYMLDTAVFNRVLEGRLAATVFDGREIVVLGVQKNELENTPDPTRRAELLGVFERLNPTIVLASSFIFDIEGAGWDQAEWNDGTGRFERMLAALKSADKKDRPSNQLRDIVIAETAIKRGAILITGDTNLMSVVIGEGGQAQSWTSLLLCS